MDKYSISIQWSDEDNGYIATVPELKGLSAFGTSKEEAFRELQVAKEAYIDVFKEDGCELPEPDLLNNYSGQFRLRLPKSLHAYLSKTAERENVSSNTLIISMLSQGSNSQSIVAAFKDEITALKDEITALKDEIQRLDIFADYISQKEFFASCNIYDQNQPIFITSQDKKFNPTMKLSS